jgi:DNA replication protein DnaC
MNPQPGTPAPTAAQLAAGALADSVAQARDQGAGAADAMPHGAASHGAASRGAASPGAARELPARSQALPAAHDSRVLTQGRCETHGAYPLGTIDPDGTMRWHSPGCPACRRDAAAQALVSRAAIAPRFAHCTFDNYEVEGSAGAAQDARLAAQIEERRGNRDACRAYAQDFARMRAQGACLVLRGLPGTGKNHLATAIAREVLARGYSVLNATAHGLIRRIRDTWDRAPGEKDEREVLRELAQVDLLIIDEAGRHYGARDGRDNIELFQVIDARYRALMPTLVISNLEREALRASLGEAAFDRLREGGGRMLHFDWPSYRGRAAPALVPEALPANHNGEQ